MSKREKLVNLINNEQLYSDIENIFKKCYLGNEKVTDFETTIFIYYTIMYFMNILLDEKTINKTSGSIVTNEQVKNGLSFENTIAAVTAFENKYLFEFGECLKDILKDNYTVGLIYVTSAIGHEIYHIYQRQSIENKNISIENLINSLEFISRNQDEAFYEDNYNQLHFETSAEFAGIILSINYLEKIIGRKLKKSELDYIQYLFIDNNPKNLYRFNNEDEIVNYVNELIYNVKDYLRFNPELFDKYPITKLIFNTNGEIKDIVDIIRIKDELIEAGYAKEENINRVVNIIIKALKVNKKELKKEVK